MAQQHEDDINEEDEDEYEDEDEQLDEENAQVQQHQQPGDEGEGEDEEDEEDEEEAAQPWAGLRTLQEREDVISILRDLKTGGRKQLTVLLLGKSGVGMSSTANSIFGETVARVAAFKLQADSEITSPITRQIDIGDPDIDGFKLQLLDTCGLEDPEAGDTVHYAALQRIAEDIRGVPIDVVLYVDRLDLYRVEPLDRAIIKAITNTFGKRIWANTMLLLTHGNMVQTPPGTTYDGFVDRRVRSLRGAMRRLFFRPALPAVLVDNSASCHVEDGKRVLPDGSAWMLELMSGLVDMATTRKPYKYHPRMTKRPNNALKLAIPLVVAAQYFFWTRVLQPVLEADLSVVEQDDENVWQHRARQRTKQGLHPPIKPSKEAAWRLEQLYEED